MLEHGSGAPLEITCLLDPDNEKVVRLSRARGPDDSPTWWPSRRITFYRDAERVAARHVTALNETAARLRVPDPPAGQHTYACMLRVAEEHRPPRPDGLGDDDAVLRSDENTLLSTAQPTSLETSGPPPLVPPDQEIGVCMNSVFVGCKYTSTRPLVRYRSRRFPSNSASISLVLRRIFEITVCAYTLLFKQNKTSADDYLWKRREFR